MGYFRENIERAEGYVPGFQPGQANVIKLNTNENPYPPCPAVIEAIGGVKPEQLRRYPDPLGNSFREAAARVNGVEPGQIICCNGGDELLNICVRAFCDEKRALAYPVPTYSLYPVLAGIQNCPVIEVPFDREFNLPAKLVKTGAALTILCNPNAPSGSFISVAEIASLADELSGVLLIDEAYADFAEDNCVRLLKDFDNVIILRSMSKGYSLAGLRFGYGIARGEMIEGLLKLKDSYNVNATAIAGATAAIKEQEYFRGNVEKVKKARALLTAQLRALGFEVLESKANFVFAEHKKANAERIYSLLIERNIYVRYWRLEGIENKLRITVGTPEQNDILVLALKEILSQE